MRLKQGVERIEFKSGYKRIWITTKGRISINEDLRSHKLYMGWKINSSEIQRWITGRIFVNLNKDDPIMISIPEKYAKGIRYQSPIR